jgi:hypothetical protein
MSESVEALAERELVGIPGAFIEGVKDCLPDAEWGIVLSVAERDAFLARLAEAEAERDILAERLKDSLRRIAQLKEER